MPHPFAYVELHSQDPRKATDFYKKLFDWKTSASETPGGTYTELEPGEGISGGLLSTRGTAPSAWVVYVKVDDVEVATRRAAELGAKVLTSKQHVPDTGWFSLCTDPAGAVFGLWQPMPGRK